VADPSNSVTHVSTDNKFVDLLLTISDEMLALPICDNFLVRIFKTAASAGNK